MSESGGDASAVRTKRDWVAIAALALAGLPGLAAFVALIFSYQASKATDTQLQIAERGQIAVRYTAAIADLGSGSEDIRIGGIYALQHLMQDSPRDYQSTVVAVLCAFVRDHDTLTPRDQPESPLATDIQAAVTVVGTRNIAKDGHATFVELYNTDLAGGQFGRDRLGHADLFGADLTFARLTGADLTGADLAEADLTWADFSGANLTGADLTDANVTSADFTDANLTKAILTDANMAEANLNNALWPAHVAVPKNWLRDTRTGRLSCTDPGYC